eukprot:TRINITY_DN4316_c0_g1_i1.p1 TRINITY_DN4316_c0_g1~~TRINITY_DN4316_c0_g1_i1.p1  ORF type:complete len:591 (+),score=151.31 TRINITY_DN4316_c0_g1_i1:124-1896(+)
MVISHGLRRLLDDLSIGCDYGCAATRHGSTVQYKLPSSFNEAKPAPEEKVPENIGCAPGFYCISKVENFGLQHHGNYTKEISHDIPKRFSEASVWEWGCPAKGSMTPQGECRLPAEGENEAGMCWSLKGMLAGPKTPCGPSGDKCMCVRPSPSDGALGYGFTHVEIKPEFEAIVGNAQKEHGGVEVRMGNFEAQPLAACDDCMSKKDWESCRECQNCVYRDEVLDGRKTEGCFDKNFVAAHPDDSTEEDKPPDAGAEYETRNYTYLQGKKAIVHDGMWVIPHYPMWDPQPDESEDSGGQVFPFQMRSEALPNEAWVAAYKENAPKMQSLMDDLADKLEKDWGVNADAQDCTPRIGERIVKANTARNMCKQMQMLQQTLAPGKMGNFPRMTGAGAKLGCIKQDDDFCETLNCHAADENYTASVKALKSKDLACKNGSSKVDSKKLNAGGAAAGALGEEEEKAKDEKDPAQKAKDEETEARKKEIEKEEAEEQKEANQQPEAEEQNEANQQPEADQQPEAEEQKEANQQPEAAQQKEANQKSEAAQPKAANQQSSLPLLAMAFGVQWRCSKSWRGRREKRCFGDFLCAAGTE